MKDLFSRGHKGKRKSPSARQAITKTVENVVRKILGTPSTTPKSYLEEDIWDILPKTGYTYANSGGYSPRFFGRKTVTPNMSRHRLRSSRRSRSGNMYEDEVDGEFEEYDDFSDYSDTEDGVTTETLLEDGMALRSGKNLYLLKQLIHGQEAEHTEAESVGDFNNSARSKSEKKTSKLLQNQKQYSQSEHKRYSTRNAESLSLTSPVVDYSNVHARRKLENKFTGNSSYRTDSYIQQSGGFNSSDQARYSQRRRDDVVQSSDLNYSNQAQYSQRRRDDVVQSSDLNDSNQARYSQTRRGDIDQTSDLNSSARYSRRRRDDIDGRNVGYIMKTAKTTVTEEFEDLDNNGVVEKGAIEASEKASASSEEYNRRSRYINNMYGLDEDDFSDREYTDSYDTRRSYDGSSSGYDDSVSTTTTVITTITETVTTISRAVVSPVWNTVGRPVMDHVAVPVWNRLVQPAVSTLTSILLAAWSVLTWPLSTIFTVVQTVSSWLWSAGMGGVADRVGSAAGALWEMVEHVVMKFVLVDVWLFKRRRRRGCCLCLPLLLLLPLLMALYTGSQVLDSSIWRDRMWGAQSAIAGIFTRESSPPPVFITENKEYQTILNQEVRNMILQLQTDSRDRLTASDVEAIVYRIMNKESATLRADLEGSRSQDTQAQMQWKTEQEARLGDMRSRHDELLAVIQDLEGTIAGQKATIASQGAEMKAESGAYLANLEEKLAVVQAELDNLNKEYAALMLRVNACCHNETYYAVAIKDNVDAILTQMMAGHMSGNPSQDAFTEWLHSNYVSREMLDKRLQGLVDDLTAKVLVMVQDAQTAQSESQHQQQQLSQEQLQAAVYGVGEQHVRQMIEAALFKYSADKTGLPDFALESAGGTVISTRCSETFEKKTALIKVFGLPLWYVSNSPRTILQPEVHPGQCWAFKGPTGYIVIQTSTIITPTGFTLEHIPKSLAPSGEIDSAPKDFTVFGLRDEYDDKGQWLGNFTYNDDGHPVQYFPAELKGDRTVFNLFELRILNNYGNHHYTCLYRFRIHGKPYKP